MVALSRASGLLELRIRATSHLPMLCILPSLLPAPGSLATAPTASPELGARVLGPSLAATLHSGLQRPCWWVTPAWRSRRGGLEIKDRRMKE